MKREKENYPITRPDGKVTIYEAEVIKRDDARPLVIIRDSPENKGPKFCDFASGRDKATEEQMKKIAKDYNVTPDKITMYRERPDGNYDHVKFKKLGWDPYQKGVQWTEAPREGGWFTKEHVDKVTQKYIANDKQVQAEVAKQTNLTKASLPQVNRDAIGKDERREMQQKVHKQQEQQKRKNHEQGIL
jgi:hypothetical protein